MLSRPHQKLNLAWDRSGVVRRERRDGFGVEEYTDDGSKYEGQFVKGLHHGTGRFTWRNGQYYEGSFYKDYRHGDGCYYWTNGHKFTGKFYLNRREGYGRQKFPDGAIFQGLFREQWFGPGVLRYPDATEDVGLWVGDDLIQLCTAVKDAFSLKTFPEYASLMTPSSSTYVPPQIHSDHDLPSDERCIYPPDMESFSTNGEFLPLPPGRREELDQQFFGSEWEPDVFQYKGLKRDPLSDLPLQPRMKAHIYKHRLLAKNLDWDVDSILSSNRESFGPKGLLEVISENFIQLSSRGDREGVSQEICRGLVHPGVSDSSGHSALIAATVNCHHRVIRLLLDSGVGVDEPNAEGMTALAVCHVLYYPFHRLNTTLIRTAAEHSESSISKHLSQDHVSTDQPETGNNDSSSSDQDHDRLATLMLLLERGADPNKACVPLPVLFLAVMAADVEQVKKLLLCGARTDIPLTPQDNGVYPLHVAAALTGTAGVQITEMLLHTILDPDALTCEQEAQESGGRTALHIACQRETDYQNASKVVSLLLGPTGARTDVLWMEHSPLSLAIENGNQLAVEVLLKKGADPNLSLDSFGNATCSLSTLNSHFGPSRLDMLDTLLEAGADILMLVKVEDGMGTAVDFTHYNFKQGQKKGQERVRRGSIHSVSKEQVEGTLKTPSQSVKTDKDVQRQLLFKMGEAMRKKLSQSGLGEDGKPCFSFCYYCGRSTSKTLIKCGRCHMVCYCSKSCKAKAWDDNHKEQCVQDPDDDLMDEPLKVNPRILKENYSYI